MVDRLKTRSPHSTFIQMAGNGHRLASDDLLRLMADSDTLSAVLLRYVQALLIQSTHTAMSNGSARLDERLARWLLIGARPDRGRPSGADP